MAGAPRGWAPPILHLLSATISNHRPPDGPPASVDLSELKEITGRFQLVQSTNRELPLPTAQLVCREATRCELGAVGSPTLPFTPPSAVPYLRSLKLHCGSQVLLFMQKELLSPLGVWTLGVLGPGVQ